MSLQGRAIPLMRLLFTLTLMLTLMLILVVVLIHCIREAHLTLGVLFSLWSPDWNVEEKTQNKPGLFHSPQQR